MADVIYMFIVDKLLIWSFFCLKYFVLVYFHIFWDSNFKIQKWSFSAPTETMKGLYFEYDNPKIH